MLEATMRHPGFIDAMRLREDLFMPPSDTMLQRFIITFFHFFCYYFFGLVIAHVRLNIRLCAFIRGVAVQTSYESRQIHDRIGPVLGKGVR